MKISWIGEGKILGTSKDEYTSNNKCNWGQRKTIIRTHSLWLSIGIIKDAKDEKLEEKDEKDELF